jgi:hypothetical protein
MVALIPARHNLDTSGAEPDYTVFCMPRYRSSRLRVSAKELLQRIGKSEIGTEILLQLARRSRITVEWLLTGKDSA